MNYVEIDDPENAGSFFSEVQCALKHDPARRIVVTEPGDQANAG